MMMMMSGITDDCQVDDFDNGDQNNDNDEIDIYHARV